MANSKTCILRQQVVAAALIHAKTSFSDKMEYGGTSEKRYHHCKVSEDESFILSFCITKG